MIEDTLIGISRLVRETHTYRGNGYLPNLPWHVLLNACVGPLPDAAGAEPRTDRPADPFVTVAVNPQR